MSHVIQVWQDPRPADLEDAERILGQKLATPGTSRTDALATLARALGERFPNDPRTAEGEPVWSDNSLAAGHDGSDLLTLGLELEHAADVMPDLLRLASELGLVVYDLEIGELHLPNLVAARTPRRPAAKTAPKPPTSGATARTRMRKWFKDRLVADGFTHASDKWSDGFERRFDGGRHEVRVSIGVGEFNSLKVATTLTTFLDVVIDVMAQATGSRDDWPAVSWDFGALAIAHDPALAWRFRESSTVAFVTQFGDTETFLAEMTSLFDEFVLPQLRAAQTPAGAWHVIAQQLDAAPDAAIGTTSPGVAAIVGQLCGDARSEQFAQRFVDRLANELADAQMHPERPSSGIVARNARESIANFEKLMAVVRSLTPIA